MYCHIFQKVIDIHIVFQIRSLRNIFQGLHHPLVVLFSALCDLTVPDRLVTVQFIVCIVQIRTAASGLRTATSVPHLHAFRLVEFSLCRSVIPKQEAVLHALQGQITAPVLAVDGNARVIIK